MSILPILVGSARRSSSGGSTRAEGGNPTAYILGEGKCGDLGRRPEDPGRINATSSAEALNLTLERRSLAPLDARAQGPVRRVVRLLALT